MIQKCDVGDIDRILEIINDSAQAYKGIIPHDRWKEPYMEEDELRHEIVDGVSFWGYWDEGSLVAVMGIQDVKDVTLIRHAYVLTDYRSMGLGTLLFKKLTEMAVREILIGTWAAAYWAIDFYRKNGFEVVSEEEKNRLLQTYWSIPKRQIETSVVLKETV